MNLVSSLFDLVSTELDIKENVVFHDTLIYLLNLSAEVCSM